MKILLGLLGVLAALPMMAWGAEMPSANLDDKAAVVEGNNAFAIDLYGQLRSRSGNLFFSPESISIALAMTYAGANGGTAVEMARTLHFTLAPARLAPAMGQVLRDLNAAHTGYQLSVANALWGQQGYKFLAPFLAVTERDYGAGLHPVDFKSSPEMARGTINRWIAAKTQDKIQDLIAPGMLTADTRLVLTNAVYFKGDWDTQFNKAQTKDGDFHASATDVMQRPLMHCTGGFKYLDGGTFQALEIPYKGSDLSMILFLPKDLSGLGAFEQTLTAAQMQQWLGQLRPVSKVVVTLPKFKMAQQFSLQPTLGAMGMRTAFEEGRADFSRITDDPLGLFISAVVHKAFVDVNEEGTEAAAATAVIMAHPTAVMRPRPPLEFRADHPFLFLIRENESGAILFLGRVAKPD